MTHMAVKIGDTVRFLDTTGGGRVIRIEGQLAFVEDQDGFEVPVMMSDLVVVEAAGEVKETPSAAGRKAVQQEVEEEEGYEYEEDESVDDTNPRFHLCVLQGDKEGVQSGNVRLHVVNDSNFFCFYTIGQVNVEGKAMHMYHGLIEPNTKLLLGKHSVIDIDEETWDVQLLMFKKSKSYTHTQPLSSTVKIKAARFFKENSFVENDYFHEKAVIIPVIKGEFERKLEALSDKELAKVKREKEKQPARKKYARRDEPSILEVDLHIDELLDNTSGLSNGEMLNIQMDKFHEIMKANEKNKGRKLVFIHGVGQGTLKMEIRKALDRQYKKHIYQDASFREYGYGATMVII
ncbi:DUF2027 domain-containing protein [Marinilabiliaceae bacterium JC017]|nr:DUF2027 domain-containing protein [Marinilabiliaceae bacterium JC017]